MATLTNSTAIEHIRHLKSNDSVVRRDTERMKMELEMGRRSQEEIHALQTELSRIWEDMQRLDPNRSHIYGHFTNTLTQQTARPAPTGPPSMLPPVQPPAGQWGSTPSGAMQGVEYPPSGQHYDRR
jgi:hypothetical protein